ncbi:immunity 17 family protein [Actinomyces sp. zg-332]|uniref:immunity 17 family protein n=1 Tax=Actinomyces sp. zg-332 TaxID=2708340 RepID=UPI00142405B2|nr:immunity 17 family protein [Actinomyces sp. zg-332]QPK93729.1 immunity 17 family protein [Actinomyces sp. zg-332]
MDKITELLKSYYQFPLMGFGILVLIAAIRDWDWVVRKNPSGRNKTIPWIILSIFGEKGYRVFLGIMGIVLVISGMGLFILSK